MRWAFGLALALMLSQVAAWRTVLMIADTGGRAGADWNPDLVAAFLLGLIAVLPCTTIGAALGATAVVQAGWGGRPQRSQPRP